MSLLEQISFFYNYYIPFQPSFSQIQSLIIFFFIYIYVIPSLKLILGIFGSGYIIYTFVVNFLQEKPKNLKKFDLSDRVCIIS